MCSKNIDHAQKNLIVVKIIFEQADGTGILGSYYKYGNYKCYRPIFLDCTVRIFEKYLRKSEQYV